MNNDIMKRGDNPKIFYFNLDLMNIIEILYIIVLILSIVGLVQKIRKSAVANKR